MRTLKAWNVYRVIPGAASVYVETVHFQSTVEASDVWGCVEYDYDFPIIVKADDIDEVE